MQATEEPQGKIQQMWQETGALIADLKKTMEKLLTTQSNLEELLQKTEGMENAVSPATWKTVSVSLHFSK